MPSPSTSTITALPLAATPAAPSQPHPATSGIPSRAGALAGRLRLLFGQVPGQFREPMRFRVFQEYSVLFPFPLGFRLRLGPLLALLWPFLDWGALRFCWRWLLLPG